MNETNPLLKLQGRRLRSRTKFGMRTRSVLNECQRHSYGAAPHQTTLLVSKINYEWGFMNYECNWSFSPVANLLCRNQRKAHNSDQRLSSSDMVNGSDSEAWQTIDSAGESNVERRGLIWTFLEAEIWENSDLEAESRNGIITDKHKAENHFKGEQK